MITDYSTTVLDFLAFEKPFILYAPDLEKYENTRGFFVDYRSLTRNMTTDAASLDEMVRRPMGIGRILGTVAAESPQLAMAKLLSGSWRIYIV